MYIDVYFRILHAYTIIYSIYLNIGFPISFDLWECNECPPETSQEFFSSESPVVAWVWFDLWSGGDLVANGPDDIESS